MPLASADRRAAMGQGRGQARVGWRIADPEWLPATRDRGIVGSWSGVVDTVDRFFRERRAIALCKNLAHQTPELHTFILPGPALDPLGGKAVRDSPWICRFVSSAQRLTSGALRRRAMAAVSARRSRSPLTKGLCSRVAACPRCSRREERPEMREGDDSVNGGCRVGPGALTISLAACLLTLVPVKPAARTRTAPTASRARASARC